MLYKITTMGLMLASVKAMKESPPRGFLCACKRRYLPMHIEVYGAQGEFKFMRDVIHAEFKLGDNPTSCRCILMSLVYDVEGKGVAPDKYITHTRNGVKKHKTHNALGADGQKGSFYDHLQETWGRNGKWTTPDDCSAMFTQDQAIVKNKTRLDEIERLFKQDLLHSLICQLREIPPKIHLYRNMKKYFKEEDIRTLEMLATCLGFSEGECTSQRLREYSGSNPDAHMRLAQIQLKQIGEQKVQEWLAGEWVDAKYMYKPAKLKTIQKRIKNKGKMVDGYMTVDMNESKGNLPKKEFRLIYAMTFTYEDLMSSNFKERGNQKRLKNLIGCLRGRFADRRRRLMRRLAAAEAQKSSFC